MTIWRRWLAARRADDGAAASEPGDRGPGIGEQLRERRRALGLTLADAERDTRINRLYLGALEDEHFDTLPAPVYARGFMRSYARYLGLDAEAAARAIPRDLPRPAGLEPIPGLRRPGGGALPGLHPGLIAGAALLALVAALVFVAVRTGGDTPAPALPEAIAPPASAPPAATAVAGPGASPAVPSAPAAPSPPRALATVTAVPAYAPGTTPDFRGVARAVAVAELERLRLRPVIVAAASTVLPAGRVFDQSPLPGTPLRPDDVVTLFVVRGSGG